MLGLREKWKKRDGNAYFDWASKNPEEHMTRQLLYMMLKTVRQERNEARRARKAMSDKGNESDV